MLYKVLLTIIHPSKSSLLGVGALGMLYSTLFTHGDRGLLTTALILANIRLRQWLHFTGIGPRKNQNPFPKTIKKWYWIPLSAEAVFSSATSYVAQNFKICKESRLNSLQKRTARHACRQNRVCREVFADFRVVLRKICSFSELVDAIFIDFRCERLPAASSQTIKTIKN